MTAAPPCDARERERLRAAFEHLARNECAERSPLYERICLALAGDDEVLALLARVPRAQRRPSLLLAAIHDLLLGGAEHDLAAHYPTVAGCGAPRGDPGALALDFCRAHHDALADLLATRSTQTNEVNRCAALLPALACAAPAGQPLRLVELGASAGLNLLVDSYACRYGRADGGGGWTCADRCERADGSGGWTSAPHGFATTTTTRVACDCVVDGELPPLDPAPRIAQRIGVDRDPIDVRDERAARWLQACVWPDEPDRQARLRAAIALARQDPPTVLRGDGLALLGELVGDGDAVHPVIWHSWVLAYWTPAAQRELTAAIDELGARRDLTWIYFEHPRETPGLPASDAPGVRHHPADSALVAVSYRSAARTVQRLADAHPHVHRMRWLA